MVCVSLILKLKFVLFFAGYLRETTIEAAMQRLPRDGYKETEAAAAKLGDGRWKRGDEIFPVHEIHDIAVFLSSRCSIETPCRRERRPEEARRGGFLSGTLLGN